ncbi:la protein 1-like [Salvia splendens]|uniref:la protein 1-like n=1 Tax=Salvia splendens TaxID=180675 RepID=UPI001C270FD3|nr:la protein 1-like [Salvia splendens]
MAPLDDETAREVIRQVEFYFSDNNLPRDNFLMKTISESEDGMVSLSLLCSFSRMKGHLSLGDVKPEDVSEVTVQAVAETLKTSTFLKISDDGKKVGRVTELPKPEEVIKQADDRTIDASPLAYDVKLEQVESFFSHNVKVHSVWLPRHAADNRLLCGTTLIEFSSAFVTFLEGKKVFVPFIDMSSTAGIEPHSVNVYGNIEGSRSIIRWAFDPGGVISPKLLFRTLFVVSWFPP